MDAMPEWELAMARRRKGEYATFNVYTEGLSAQAQELRKGETFVEDIAGSDGAVHSLKPEIVQARRKQAETYEQLVKARSEIKRKFEEETMRQHRQRLDRAMKILRPEPKQPQPAHNQVFYENGMVATVPSRNPNAIKRRF